jgi:hypothetical protein
MHFKVSNLNSLPIISGGPSNRPPTSDTIGKEFRFETLKCIQNAIENLTPELRLVLKNKKISLISNNTDDVAKMNELIGQNLIEFESPAVTILPGEV